MRLQTLAILLLTLVGFALRLAYLTTTHPFFDEYTTVLAARQILRAGWPVLPSGLFYEHGLLATYLAAPFTALFIDLPAAAWQPAHWGLMLARWPSLLVSVLTIPAIFALGRRLNDQLSINNEPLASQRQPALDARHMALLAAGLFALSPEGIVWGGRARMYALATLLVLLTVYWAYRGALYQPPAAPARYRWLALAALLAALLTQFGVMMLVPPLLVSMALVGWLSYRYRRGQPGPDLAAENGGLKAWLLRRPALILALITEGLALAAVIGLAVWVKRLGRPLGFSALDNPESSGYLAELSRTVAYQTTFYFTWDDTITFLARQFGVPHHLWLAVITVVGLLIGLVHWVSSRRKGDNKEAPISYSQLYLCLIFGLIVVEMVTLLEPFRRNPRYLVMYLPLFYLIAARAIFNFGLLFAPLRRRLAGLSPRPVLARPEIQTALTLIILALLAGQGWADVRLAFVTPEPAYEAAFAQVRANWQPGDALLTMNTPAAGLYLGGADGFTVQADAEQFLLETPAGPVDRWLGAPWIGSMAGFNSALNRSPRTWFVIDAIRLPVYFRGDWQALLNSQMEQVWSDDNALVYRTRPDRTILPTQPEQMSRANLDNLIELVGYTLNEQELRPSPESDQPATALSLTLFWRPLAPLSTDYTIFLHLRNSEGVTVAQHDSQPVAGSYPTSRWQPNEIVIDPVTLPVPDDLPAGAYTLFAGLYRLDTLARLPVVNDTSGENAVRLAEVTLQ